MKRLAGFTIVELMIAVSLSLVLVTLAYQLTTQSHHAYVKQTDQAALQAVGRGVLTLVGSDLRNAGYSALGAPLVALAFGDSQRVRILADLDADGRVLKDDGIEVEKDEHQDTVSYVFSDPDGNGIFELSRGVDLNGDWEFDDGDDWTETLHTRVVQLDLDGDATPDPFIAYDSAAPRDARHVQFRFGLEAPRRDLRTGRRLMIPFSLEVALRNRASGEF